MAREYGLNVHRQRGVGWGGVELDDSWHCLSFLSMVGNRLVSFFMLMLHVEQFRWTSTLLLLYNILRKF